MHPITKRWATNHRYRTAFQFTLLTFVCFSLTHCAQKENVDIDRDQPGVAAPGPTEPPAPVAVQTEGWEKVSMIANSAKTDFDSAAHFTTTRNACGRDRYGVFDLDAWNTLATAMNAALQSPTLPEPRCYPRPETWPFMDGTAEVSLENGTKRMLFENRNYYEICSNISDPEVARKLLNLLNQVVVRADKDGCPNGWGSD